MPTNVKKTLTDAGYIAVGLGVMGFQQAQIHARAACSRVNEVGGSVADHARGARSTIDTQTQSARVEAEAQLRSAVARATDQARVARGHVETARGHVEKRVEPVVGQVQAQLSDLPERVVQAMEPVAARVREFSGNAA